LPGLFKLRGLCWAPQRRENPPRPVGVRRQPPAGAPPARDASSGAKRPAGASRSRQG